MISLRIEGKCISKKNSRATKKGRKSKKTGKQTLYPGKSDALKAYEKHATMQLQGQWAGEPPLQGPIGIRVNCFFSGTKPDCLGFLETIFDVLEYARVLENDRQLVPFGKPAVSRFHVKTGRERVEIALEHIKEDQP